MWAAAAAPRRLAASTTRRCAFSTGLKPIATVDAFCRQSPEASPVAFTGNPAAVCFIGNVEEPAPTVEWMRNVAAEMNLSETAYLRRTGPGHFLLRWFTPTDEVDLCGHATLASSHALWEAGHTDADQPIHFETLSGELIASRTANCNINTNFPRIF